MATEPNNQRQFDTSASSSNGYEDDGKARNKNILKQTKNEVQAV